MNKISCDFSCMVPTIFFEENLASQLIKISRQKKLSQLILIAQVRVKNTKIEFHCSSLILDQDSEISIREDEVPIFLKVLSDEEYCQPVSNELEAMKEGFYEMIEETSNQYNANNIYSLISDVAFINNQLNVRISLFCPKSSINIEEIGTSDAPSVCSIPGATYRFPKDKKVKDPNSIYAIYYGINGIKDPRIYSLSYSIYLQQRKPINAAFNNKLYRITFHENEDFELLTTTFSINKPTSLTARFNLTPPNSNLNSDLTNSQNPKYQSQINNEFNTRNNNNNNNDINYQQPGIFELPSEFYDSIRSMKDEIKTLRKQIKEEEERIENKLTNKLDEHEEEIKTLLQNILNEVQKAHSNERTNSKPFLHRQISRKPVIPLTISLTTTFENTEVPTQYSYQQQYSSLQQQQANIQQKKQLQTEQRQKTHLPYENPNNQTYQPTKVTQNQVQTQNQTFMKTTISQEQTQQLERQRPKYSIDSKSSFEKGQSTKREPINTSSPSIQATRRISQPLRTQTSTNYDSVSNRINTSVIKHSNSNINSTNSISKDTISIKNNNNSKNNYNIKKGTNSNSRNSKTSSINIENWPDNDNLSSKHSKESAKFSNQLFNEPSFDISAQTPDFLNESPNKKDNTAQDDQSDLSFMINNDFSVDTKRLFNLLSLDDKKTNS